MAHAHTSDEWSVEDPELRDSIRVMKHQRSMRLLAVVVAMLGAIGTAALYAALSYGGR